MIRKTITVELTAQGLAKAIREIEQFKRQLKAWCDELVRALVEEGVEVGKANVRSMGAVDTGALEDSIQGVFFPSEMKGIIFTDAQHAIYVEFGTGSVGAEGPQHPMKQVIADELESYHSDGSPKIHDIHDHGEGGWVYYLQRGSGAGTFRWTKGMESRPFMYETLRWLEQNADDIASGVSWKE